MRKFDNRVRTILLDRGLISQEALDSAELLAVEERKSLCQLLVERGTVKERDLIGAVAAEIGLPPIDVERVEIDREVLDVLPQDLASYYGVLPIAKLGNVLTVAVSNPFDLLKLDQMQIVTKCQVRPVVSSEMAIRQMISRTYSPEEEEMNTLFEGISSDSVEELGDAASEGEDFNVADLASGSTGSPVVKLVNLLIFQAIRNRVSDIHIEPFRHKLRVRYRQDGLLQETICPPKRMQNAIVSRIKIMSDLDIAERHKPQDGKFRLRVDGRQIDFRVSILPVVHGEKVVLRVLDAASISVSLENLGFEREGYEHFKSAISNPWGMILVTGPTGSGKSTSLYSGVREILSVQTNIVTVEDPVEYQLEGVNQVPVNPKRGITFANALRSSTRWAAFRDCRRKKPRHDMARKAPSASIQAGTDYLDLGKSRRCRALQEPYRCMVFRTTDRNTSGWSKGKRTGRTIPSECIASARPSSGERQHTKACD